MVCDRVSDCCGAVSMSAVVSTQLEVRTMKCEGVKWRSSGSHRRGVVAWRSQWLEQGPGHLVSPAVASPCSEMGALGRLLSEAPSHSVFSDTWPAVSFE